jgi:hypothetical protein
MPSREAILTEALGPDWASVIEQRRKVPIPLPGDNAVAIKVIEVLWRWAEESHRTAVDLLRMARGASLGDFDVDVLELRLDERLRKEADDAYEETH